MSDRVLTTLVKAAVLNGGMDLVGFAPTSRWAKAPFLMSPQAILPGSRTVIVGAIHITDTWTEMGGEPEPQDRSPGGWMDQNSLMDRVAYRIVRLLEDHGHKAIAVASSNIWRYRKFEGIPSLFAPDLSHMHAAAAAGLAIIGWSGLAITPEFGPRVRYISIVTDAELDPTPMYRGPELCDLCMDCVRTCPTLALSKDFNSAKPHVVEIEGQVFKYANKNAWRCAWAEHFNLDLNTETTRTVDHVDEEVILREMAEKGRRGHERGVCQKVCIPPHLRTDEPSFGRPDKKIAMRRINRRYPETLPTLRKMRDDLIVEAARLGVELAACGPLNVETKAGQLAVKDAPGMRTVLAFAIRLPPEAVGSVATAPDVQPVFGVGYARGMHHILLRLARRVEDYGYHAASYTGLLPPDHRPEVSELAAMAGLGVLDADGVLNTPEFGRSVMVGAITTDAPLDPTPAATETMPAPAPRPALRPARLRAELESTAHDNLVSLFGVAGVDVFDRLVEDLRANVDEALLGERVVDDNPDYHGPYRPRVVREAARLRHPRDLLPEARSVIVLGMHFPRAIMENAGNVERAQIGTYAFYQYETCFELRFAAVEVMKKLNAAGYRAVPSENLTGVGSLVASHRGMLPDARCNALEAVAAGLGRLGRSGALLTPEYGPHQRLIAIVTDAELPSDTVQQGVWPCADCIACVEACPMTALAADGGFEVRVNGAKVWHPGLDRHRCDWSKRYALCKEEGPALIGNKTDVSAPEGKITIEMIAGGCVHRDPIMKSRPCILETCLKVCPAGRSGA